MLEMNYYENKGAGYTAKEIYQQPLMWAKAKEYVLNSKETINHFLDQVFKHEDHEIIFTGAGTSEFVGNSLFPYISTITNHKCKSIGTTDIVSTPKCYLNENRYTLLVSFARSGNSPESVASVNIANKICKNIYHLIITCNKDGKLSLFGKDKDNCLVINLPEETNDKSFAMTSSYSTMYLTALMCFAQYENVEFVKQVDQLIENGQKFLDENNTINEIVNNFDYDRIVYLGSNCLKGVAQESALKTCELTAGNIMTTYDSTMGFRHGPKSVVKEKTLSVIYLSDEHYTRQYDRDIAREIFNEHIGKVLVVSGHDCKCAKESGDYFISFDNDLRVDSVYLGLEYILVGQLLGMTKSIKMNNTPDNPCSTGQVSRVVHGVNIYEYEG